MPTTRPTPFCSRCGNIIVEDLERFSVAAEAHPGPAGRVSYELCSDCTERFTQWLAEPRAASVEALRPGR